MSALEYPLAMTREAFEAWAPTVTERWEWVRGFAIPVPHAFAGGTWAHARVASRIFAKLSAGLQAPCEPVIGALMRLATPTSQRYGDIYIVCEQIDPAATVLATPKVVIEVVSHESVERDLFEKRDEYLGIAGLEAYFASSKRSVASWSTPHAGNMRRSSTVIQSGFTASRSRWQSFFAEL